MRTRTSSQSPLRRPRARSRCYPARRAPRGRTAARSAATRRHDDPRRRLLRRGRRRGPAGDAPRRLPRAPAAHLRADRLRHEPGRPVLRRHVPRGRRPRRRPACGSRADPARRGLHQADGDRSALGRARGSRSRSDDRGGGRHACRGGSPAGLSRRRARRGARGHRDRDRGGRRHDRARHVPEPAARPARADGPAGPGARADALLLLRRRDRRGGGTGARCSWSWRGTIWSRPTRR